MSNQGNVTINITARANMAGANAAAGAMTNVANATQAATQATNPWVTASRNAAAANTQQAQATNSNTQATNQQTTAANNAAAAANQQAAAQHRAAGSGVNFGQAMLQGSRALDDLQYGVVGVINNIEGIATAMGFGAGAAGVATVLAITISQLAKRFGDLSTASREYKVPELSPDEEQQKRLEAMTRALEAQTLAIERRTTALLASNQALQDQIDYQIKLADLLHEPEAGKSPEEDARHEQEQLDQRTRQRHAQVEKARIEAEGKGQIVVAEDAAYQKQKELTEGLQKRVGIEKAINELTKQAAEMEDAMRGTAESERERVFPEESRRLNETKATIGRLKAEQQDLPHFNEAARPADPKEEQEWVNKQLEENKKRLLDLEKQRDEAVEAARRARRDHAQQVDQKARQEQDLDEIATQQKVNKILGQTAPLPPHLPGEPLPPVPPSLPPTAPQGPRIMEPGPDPVELQPEEPAEDEAAKGKGAKAAKAKAEEAPSMDDQIIQAKDWLSGQIAQTNNMGARNDLMNLKAALLDGQGNSEGELAAIQNLMAKVAEGKTNAITALHQTMQDVAGMSENMARSVTNIAETLKAQAARIEALKAETESIRNQMRTN